MTRLVEDLEGRALLDQLACVQHSDAVAHARDDAEVVADEEQRCRDLSAERRDQVEHLGLDRCVESGGGLVKDQQRRLHRQRHGDHHPLLHPARELVWIAAHDGGRIRDPHARQDLLGAGVSLLAAAPGHLEHLGNLTPDPDRRVEGAGGVLIDHRHAAAAHLAQLRIAQLVRVAPIDQDRAAGHPAVPRQVPNERERNRRLTASGLADQPERLAPAHLERYAANRGAIIPAHAVDDVELIDRQRERLGGMLGGDHSSVTFSIASATRLTAITSDAIAPAANSTSHQ